MRQLAHCAFEVIWVSDTAAVALLVWWETMKEATVRKRVTDIPVKHHAMCLFNFAFLPKYELHEFCSATNTDKMLTKPN